MRAAARDASSPVHIVSRAVPDRSAHRAPRIAWGAPAVGRLCNPRLAPVYVARAAVHIALPELHSASRGRAHRIMRWCTPHRSIMHTAWKVAQVAGGQSAMDGAEGG